MRVVLIRHGITEGNKRRAYIGAGIDEPLCDDGIIQLGLKCYPRADIIFTSPMKRCIMTAEYIYPEQEIFIVDGLKEIGFGDFEGKTYEQLKNDYSYNIWLESGGEAAFPNGEAKKDFAIRSRNAFKECLKIIQKNEKKIETAVFVVHGGTIMAIMEEYGHPKGEYYKWQIKNGEIIEFDI